MPRTQRPRTPSIKAIAKRLLGVFEHDLRFTVADAARALGYSNATTLHKARRGLALPDFARVAAFAERHGRQTGRTINLHYVLTGSGAPLVPYPEAESDARSNLDVDIINLMASAAPETKQALRVLLERAR